MLAKEIKIRTLKQQRIFLLECIEETLKNARESGDTSVWYFGHIYPENAKYLKQEGFTVKKFKDTAIKDYTDESKNTSEIFVGTVYIITVSDKLELTDEELQEAEEIEPLEIELPLDDSNHSNKNIQ